MTEEKESMAISTAETFVEHFYGRMDTKRHAVDKLYLDRAVVAWNGNKLEGTEAIQKFLLSLPESEHEMLSLSAQPVLASAVAGQTTVTVQVAGNVKFSNQKKKPFQQNFLLIADAGDKWKIATESFRSQEFSGSVSSTGQ